MKTLFPYFRIFIFLYITFMISNCRPPECRDLPVGVYTFILPVTVEPARQTYSVGDTITITSSFGNMVEEKYTGNTYLLDSFAFFPASYVENYTNNETTYDFEGLEFIADTASQYDNFQSFSDGSDELNGQYEYDGMSYRLSYKVVPTTPGIYALYQGAAILVLGEKQNFPGKCQQVPIQDGCMVVNDGAPNGIELLEARRAENERIDWILREPDFRFHGMGGFAFEVVE